MNDYVCAFIIICDCQKFSFLSQILLSQVTPACYVIDEIYAQEYCSGKPNKEGNIGYITHQFVIKTRKNNFFPLKTVFQGPRLLVNWYYLFISFLFYKHARLRRTYIRPLANPRSLFSTTRPSFYGATMNLLVEAPRFPSNEWCSIFLGRRLPSVHPFSICS